jgi:hypothetical protein
VERYHGWAIQRMWRYDVVENRRAKDERVSRDLMSLHHDHESAVPKTLFNRGLDAVVLAVNKQPQAAIDKRTSDWVENELTSVLEGLIVSPRITFRGPVRPGRKLRVPWYNRRDSVHFSLFWGVEPGRQ